LLAVVTNDSIRDLFVSRADSQTFCVDAWNGHRRRPLIAQSQNAVWSAGAFISPFIMKSFLVEIVEQSNVNNVSNNSYAAADNFMRLYSPLDDVTSSGSVDQHHISTDVDMVAMDSLPVGLQMVRSAYVTIGLLSLMLVLPTFAMYFYINGATLPCRRRQKQPPSELTDKDVGLQSWSSRWPSRSAVFYVIVVFYIGILYGGLELTPRSFFTSFVVRYLSWTVHDATLLLSVFYATFGAGRLLAVPLSTVISPAVMLTFNIIFIGIGLGILLLVDFIVNLNPIFVWIGSGLVGFGLSSSYACLVLVVSTAIPEVNLQRQSLNVSTVLSALSIGCNVGFVLFPVLVGNLFDYRSPIWMVYVLIGVSVCEAVLLVVRRALVRTM